MAAITEIRINGEEKQIIWNKKGQEEGRFICLKVYSHSSREYYLLDNFAEYYCISQKEDEDILLEPQNDVSECIPFSSKEIELLNSIPMGSFTDMILSYEKLLDLRQVWLSKEHSVSESAVEKISEIELFDSKRKIVFDEKGKGEGRYICVLKEHPDPLDIYLKSAHFLVDNYGELYRVFFNDHYYSDPEYDFKEYDSDNSRISAVGDIVLMPQKPATSAPLNDQEIEFLQFIPEDEHDFYRFEESLRLLLEIRGFCFTKN